MVNVNRTDSDGQPLTFATRLVGRHGTAGAPVSGAVPGINNANQPWLLLGDGTQYNTRQDHLKLKLAYDLTPALRASYVFGLWHNNRPATPAPISATATREGLQRPDQHRRPQLP